MPLDPRAKRFLDMAAAAGTRDIAALTPQEMRHAFLQLSETVEGRRAPTGGVVCGELPGPGGALAYRIYAPVDPVHLPCPGLVYFHGGGWVFGDLDTHDGICRRLANASGCRVIAVAYRLAPEHGFPAAIEDSHAAVTWVTQHARELGLDPSRIAIGGDSAGGNLAAVVCQRAKAAGPKLALQVLLCPVLDLGGETPSRRDYSEGYFLDRATIDWTLQHYLANGVGPHDPQVSPLRAGNFRGLPPTHIHTAEFDPMRDDGEAYAGRLARDGVAVLYTRHEGMIHNFFGMAGVIPYGHVAMAAAGAAIRQALA